MLIFSFLTLLSPGAFAAPTDHTLDLVTESERVEVSESASESSPPAGGLPWKDYFSRHPNLKSLELGIKMEGVAPLVRQVSTPMIPASVEKIFTASTALHHLGPSMRFENTFSGQADPLSGTLINPHFRISGDPTWGSEYFEGVIDGTDAQHNEGLTSRLQAVIRSLIAHGVHRVKGPIEVESTRPKLATERRPEGWKSEWDLQCMAQIQTEFIANGNCGAFKISSPTKYGWVTTGVTLPVQVKVTRSRSGVSALRVTPVFDPLGRISSYSITGTMSSVPIEYALPVHQGAAWLRNLFVEALKVAGIDYEDSGVENGWYLVMSTKIEVDLSSAPLLEIVRTA
ncbi:hypothetical protein EB061_13295, partial [bacterium]|nr:hypothetical protein [bacterium]